MSGDSVSVWMAPGAEARLQAAVRHAYEHAPVQRDRLAAAGIDPWMGPVAMADLQRLAVMRKEDLGPLQAKGRPFGGLLGQQVSGLARIFLSPGDIYDPQGTEPDFWRFGNALRAAGFGPGDVVLNCFNYHLSPAGFMFDDAARSLGCVVIPAGVGQQELQLKVLADTRANAYVGLPSYLLSLLKRGAPTLMKAFVSAEPLPPSLRAELESYGLAVFQGYGTADLGLVAYECPHQAGMHLDDGVVLEICDPDGRPVAMGEVGEVVVTLLDATYPLLRFGTGDLTALMPGECPCGRTAPRMRGWLGRAGDAVKVRGMFVYPRQLEEAMAPFAGRVGRWQALVERDGAHRDRLVLLVEQPAEGLVEAVRAATRLTAEIRQGMPEAVAPALKDCRTWE